MTTKTKLIIAAALFAIFTAPASARFDGDEGGASAYSRFSKERGGQQQIVAPSRIRR